LLREILLENLFTRLEELYINSNFHEEIISVLEKLYSLSGYMNLILEKDISESTSLNRGFDVLFRIIISSDIHHIITLCCNTFKTLFKNFINENFNNSKSNSYIKEIIRRFYLAIFEKLGSIFVFKNKIPNLSNVSNNISALHYNNDCTNSNNNNNENENENENKYFILIHMNSPQIDYQFLVKEKKSFKNLAE